MNFAKILKTQSSKKNIQGQGFLCNMFLNAVEITWGQSYTIFYTLEQIYKYTLTHVNNAYDSIFAKTIFILTFSLSLFPKLTSFSKPKFMVFVNQNLTTMNKQLSTQNVKIQLANSIDTFLLLLTAVI